MALVALNQLCFVLVTKPKQERITREETSSIAKCCLKALCYLGLASNVGGSLGWQVAKRLKMTKGRGRFYLAAGAATASYLVAFDWANSTTAVSFLDPILKQEDATRMQRELVTTLVKNNGYEPYKQLLSRHFYLEALNSDEGDVPQIRWRKRSIFAEIATSYDDGNQAKPQNELA